MHKPALIKSLPRAHTHVDLIWPGEKTHVFLVKCGARTGAGRRNMALEMAGRRA